MERVEAVNRFYDLLNQLERILGKRRRLADCTGQDSWPQQGVYFFFEEGEVRSKSNDFRVVRVGTHAIRYGTKSTLWQRLMAHRGPIDRRDAGGGNHRGSVFRKHLGLAIIHRDGLRADYPKWGKGSNESREVRDKEYPLEKIVSQHIRKMPFLWLKVPGEAAPNNMREYIEKNAIGLLSNYGLLETGDVIDPPSSHWLGNHHPKREIQKSGLWNVKHVKERLWNPEFLKKFEGLIQEIGRGRLSF